MSDVPYGLSGGFFGYFGYSQKYAQKRIESGDVLMRGIQLLFSVGLEGSPDLAAAQIVQII
jgi:hypothetical protein